ncbi:tyrosine-type recombinase/integrase [Aquipuribacter nitratireducens]|uniref:Tyrosine-type recombinase/integrase n=1 Tax=Aquipuribacter nitratireducens TaxID=650104 RepID=A0ABW0GRH0_9MICO
MAGPGPIDTDCYDVRVFAISRTVRKTVVTYRVRWQVGSRRHSRTFTNRALADSTRSMLMAASRRGEAFDVDGGLPQSQVARERGLTWWRWSMTYVELKWPSLAPISRRSLAEALVDITLHLSRSSQGRPPSADLRRAMFAWAYHLQNRQAGEAPADFGEALRWLERASPAMSVLEDPPTVRGLLDALSRRQDGRPAAPTTVSRKRAVLHNALELAVEHRRLDSNPLSKMSWKAPRVDETIDARSVLSPAQARALLAAVDAQGPRGRRLTAFFALMYYGALRPSEATAVTLDDLELPETGWGRLHLSRSDAEVSGTWSDSGRRSSRQLKHRAQGHVRLVPLAPPLVEHLRSHIKEFHVRPSERLFRGAYGGTINAATYTDVWQRARKAALSPAEQASPLARRPYDLRHTAVSTWLAAGVDSAQVAAWAGHSVAVLHRVYAHVVEGRSEVARARIENMLAE